MTNEQRERVERLRADYCACHEAYKDRNLTDPTCESCSTKNQRYETAATIEQLAERCGRLEAALKAARAATFFCQNAGYMCERCGKHKYKHEGGDLWCPPQPSGGSEHE